MNDKEIPLSELKIGEAAIITGYSQEVYGFYDYTGCIMIMAMGTPIIFNPETFKFDVFGFKYLPFYLGKKIKIIRCSFEYHEV